MNYGEKLKYLRGRKNITQIELAKIINISNKTYCHYEKENDNIPLKHLINICNYFDVSIDYIFDFTKSMQYRDINKEIDRKKIGSNLEKKRI